MRARVIIRVHMNRIMMDRIHSVEHTIGTHTLQCIRYIRDMGLGIMDFRYQGLTSITITIMAGNTTGTETSIGTVIIIMDIDPIIIVDPVIMVDPAIIITQGLIIRVVGTMEAGIDDKKKFARSSMKPMRSAI